MLDCNPQYLSLVEIPYGFSIDGVVLTTGCDKTTPAHHNRRDGRHRRSSFRRADAERLVQRGANCSGRSSQRDDGARGDRRASSQSCRLSLPRPGTQHDGTASMMNCSPRRSDSLPLRGDSRLYRDRQEMAYLTGKRSVGSSGGSTAVAGADACGARGARSWSAPRSALDERADPANAIARRRRGSQRRLGTDWLRRSVARQHAAAGENLGGSTTGPAACAVVAELISPARSIRRDHDQRQDCTRTTRASRRTRGDQALTRRCDHGLPQPEGRLFDSAIMKTRSPDAFRERYLRTRGSNASDARYPRRPKTPLYKDRRSAVARHRCS